jgi:antibiotic biosynthesis monooxygenase (ABM) superfamily enzyme
MGACPYNGSALSRRKYLQGNTAMLVTVFRSRLRPGVRDEYVALVDQMEKLARTMPGYISH